MICLHFGRLRGRFGRFWVHDQLLSTLFLGCCCAAPRPRARHRPAGRSACSPRTSATSPSVTSLRGLPIGRGSGGAPVRRQCARSLYDHALEISSSRATSSALRVASVLATYRSARASSLLVGMARRRRSPPNVCFGSLPAPTALRGLPDLRRASIPAQSTFRTRHCMGVVS